MASGRGWEGDGGKDGRECMERGGRRGEEWAKVKGKVKGEGGKGYEREETGGPPSESSHNGEQLEKSGTTPNSSSAHDRKASRPS